MICSSWLWMAEWRSFGQKQLHDDFQGFLSHRMKW